MKQSIAVLIPWFFLASICMAQTLQPNAGNSDAEVRRSEASTGANANWDVLKELGLNQETKVVLTNAKSCKGEFQSLSDDALVIHSKDGDQTFARSSVEKVSVRHPGHHARNALIGAGFGALGGFVTGTVLDRCPPNSIVCFKHLGAEIGTPGFGVVGAVIGAVLPSGGWHEIYRAQ